MENIRTTFGLMIQGSADDAVEGREEVETSLPAFAPASLQQLDQTIERRRHHRLVRIVVDLGEERNHHLVDQFCGDGGGSARMSLLSVGGKGNVRWNNMPDRPVQ